jgi:hypothetical protein
MANFPPPSLTQCAAALRVRVGPLRVQVTPVLIPPVAIITEGDSTAQPYSADPTIGTNVNSARQSRYQEDPSACGVAGAVTTTRATFGKKRGSNRQKAEQIYAWMLNPTQN